MSEARLSAIIIKTDAQSDTLLSVGPNYDAARADVERQVPDGWTLNSLRRL